jgi:hypothetical protein
VADSTGPLNGDQPGGTPPPRRAGWQVPGMDSRPAAGQPGIDSLSPVNRLNQTTGAAFEAGPLGLAAVQARVAALGEAQRALPGRRLRAGCLGAAGLYIGLIVMAVIVIFIYIATRG